MHVLQIMLVQEEDKEGALAQTGFRTGLDGETATPSWSDWHQIGGRWEGYFEGENVLCYADNPVLAEKVLGEAIERRMASIERLKEETADVSFEEAIANYSASNPVMDFKLYSAKHLSEIVLDYWTYDSAVYDLEDYTATLKDFRKRVEESPETQFLVATDFHY